MDPSEVERRKKEGLDHLIFCCRLYKYQVKHGRHFLHEHPASAASWKADCVQEIMTMPGVGVTVGDQCEYGLTTPSSENPEVRLPAKRHKIYVILTADAQTIEPKMFW